ncbi:S8 family serine peptidase [soil metagenome]
MGGSKKLIILFLLFVFTSEGIAQVDRYVVYFRDKLNSPFLIEEPQAYLSPKAIERRERQNISINEEDLPVNPQYVSGVKDLATNIFHKSKWFNAVLIEASEAQVESIFQLPYVEKVEYVAPGSLPARRAGGTSRPLANRNNKRSSNTSAFQNQLLGVDIMHEAGFKGEGMLIGIFDGGFLNADVLPFFEHIFNSDKIKFTYDYVRNEPIVYAHNRHGTEVFSNIGAFQVGELEGTAYNADFILSITEDDVTEYRVEEYNWIFAAEAADSVGVDIINSSLGYNTFNDPFMNYTYEDVNGETAVISRASVIAAEKGIFLVSSAGNEGNKAWRYLTAPADAFGTLAVGAVNSNLEVASFSSVGPTADGRIKPDVVALGTSVVVGKIDGSIGLNNGTSFASPLVAGLVAGIWQANRELTVPQLLEKVRSSGTNFETPNNQIGYGIPNFVRAQNNIILSVNENLLQAFKIFPNPVIAGELFITSEKTYNNNNFNVKIHASNGMLILDRNMTFSHNSEPVALNINDLPPGLYGVTITSNKLSEKVKIIKN